MSLNLSIKMKIAFLINQTHKEEVNFTTTLLAFSAHKRGHDIIYIGLADFVYIEENDIHAHARILSQDKSCTSSKDLLDTIRHTEKQRLSMQDIDVLWLRFDPTLDMINRPWASDMGLQFARLVKRMGKMVINDPDHLIQAGNKLYLEDFPKLIRPKTLVTRSYRDVQDFIAQQQDKIILKPLKGSGGKNVFLITPDEQQNLKQTVEVIARDGYVIAQEYLPMATEGDIRFFLLDGKPIHIQGKYAAVRRIQQSGEIRSNLHQGASAVEVEVNQEILHLTGLVAEKLKRDNMYFVGLDIVGDKIMEVNVFSPGALRLAEELCGVDFSTHIIAHLEQKVQEKNQ